jgi:hypothetical protein
MQFDVFNLSYEGTMELSEQLTQLVECTCREVINDAHPVPVEALGGQENLVSEVSCEPSDEGLSIGAPGRPWTHPHGHTCVAAVLEFEKPLQEPVTPVVLAADESAMASTGGGHA